jgi:hypothetical protein
MTNPVTLLDARALVSEIRPRAAEALAEMQHRRESGRSCRWCGGYYLDVPHTQSCPLGLLTAVLGLIEQQQEEIRKSEEIMRESDETGLPVDSLTASGNEPVHRESTE